MNANQHARTLIKHGFFLFLLAEVVASAMSRLGWDCDGFLCSLFPAWTVGCWCSSACGGNGAQRP